MMTMIIITILQLLTCLMATPASRQIISRLHSSKASTGNYHDIGTAIDDSDDDDCNNGGDVDDEKNDNAEKVETHLLKSVDVARSVIHRVMCLEENAFEGPSSKKGKKTKNTIRDGCSTTLR